MHNGLGFFASFGLIFYLLLIPHLPLQHKPFYSLLLRLQHLLHPRNLLHDPLSAHDCALCLILMYVAVLVSVDLVGDALLGTAASAAGASGAAGLSGSLVPESAVSAGGRRTTAATAPGGLAGALARAASALLSLGWAS